MTGRVPDGLPGESLVAAFEGKRRRDDHVFVEWHTPPSGPNARAVISPDGWKLGLYDTDNCVLFHRDRDPLEMSNLCYRREYADVVARLRRKIEDWQVRVQDTQRLPEPETRPSSI